MLPSSLARALVLLAAGSLAALPASAQTVNTQNIKEDFTGATTINTWLSSNGACLTAGTGSTMGALPGCLNDTYYGSQVQFGGANGYLGTNTTSAPSSASGQTADPVGSGALRLTNGTAYSDSFANGFNQNGAIISSFNFPSNNGIQITFKTVTYGGNSGGNGGSGSISANDGADGITFFLLDDSVIGTTYDTPLDSGAFGGSLGYTCSNSNNDSTLRSDGTARGFDGIVGGYIGLGVDEFGNYLNPSDNTSSGPGLQANRIGMRGAGSITWKWLNWKYPTLYPSSWSATRQQQAVQNTCHQGYLMDYHQTKDSNNNITKYGNYYTSTSSATATASTTVPSGAIAVMDYPMVTDANNKGAYKVLSGVTIATEASLNSSGVEVPVTRSQANPITYNLNITQDGKLSFSYSFNGGTWQPVIASTSITGSNGAIPQYVRFGFAGSDGGSSNIHEILCFAAQPSETSGSSGGINVYQNPTIRSGTQIFLANYFPSSWTGQLTAQTIGFNTTTNTLVANTTPNWDARCVLTGVNATTGKCSTGETTKTAEAWQAGSGTGRQLITWDSVGKSGVPFEWTSGITGAMQNIIDAGDTGTFNNNRLNFLRGQRDNEIGGTAGTNLFRTRQSVLGDIVDSSPTWIGPPQTYSNMDTWTDAIYGPGSANPVTAPENSGQKYSAFQSKYSSTSSTTTGRTNVVYVGANDGFLHGFRAGTLDQFGNLVTTNNDGYEVLAYMPGTVFNAIHNTAQAELDYPNTQYSHAWYVDGTPGTGDLFYKSSSGANSASTGTWHTWIVGGLGAGGAAIYALDVTDPSTFSEGNASTLVIGEWATTSTTTTDSSGKATTTWTSNLTCATTTTNTQSACGANYLGNTYGTPVIRRFHNGQWGVIFGNGYGSQSGTAGVFIMLVDPSSGAKTFYYLPVSSSATSNGIGPTTAADLDLDHIVDYIYAGDLLGNVWRFDVTSSDPTQWAVSSTSPLFVTQSGQPITTAVTVSTLKTIQTNFSLTGKVLDSMPERVIVNFGTGRQIPQTLTTAAQYSTGTQSLYGVWDWDMTNWNTLSPNQQGITVASGGVTPPQPIKVGNLVQQTFTTSTASGFTYRNITTPPNAVCWPSSPFPVEPNNPANPASCKTANNFGWFINLSTSGTGTNAQYEQVIFDPALSADGVFVVNTYIPAPNSPLNCTPGTPTGFSMAVEPDDGFGEPTGGYFLVNGSIAADGIQLNGIGTPSFISTGSADNNTEFMLTQSANGLATPTALQRHSVVAGQRLNWIQRR